jgi:hypothetical protein
VVNAECALDEATAAAAEGAELYFPGMALFEKCPVLGGESGDRLAALISATADRADLPKKDSRDFVYFVLGYLRCGQEELKRRGGG